MARTRAIAFFLDSAGESRPEQKLARTERAERTDVTTPAPAREASRRRG